MEFRVETGVEILAGTPATLRGLLSRLSEDWTRGSEASDAWSPWQVVAHLTHIEERDWIDRVEVILRHGPERPFGPVDREAGFDRFRDLAISELLDRFATSRGVNLERLNTMSLGPDDMAHEGLHPEFGPVTLGQLLATWVVHDLNHTGQIVKTMAKRYRDAIGPWRQNLLIVDVP